MKTVVYIGDFAQPFDTEKYIAEALEELGYRVVRVNERKFFLRLIDEVINEIVYYKPSLVLFSKGRPLGDAEVFIERLKGLGVPTACWLFDLYFDLPSPRIGKLKRKEAPFNCETIFSTDGGHDNDFKLIGIKHKLLRQGIYEPEAILYDRPKTKDVIFVGSDSFGNRAKMLDGLKKRYGKRFEWHGYETSIRNLPLNELYATAKVVVGDSFPSSRYWSNRIYETLGRGGFLLHPHVEGIEEEFEDGKHLVLYKRGDMDDLYTKIDYYLSHDEEREKIRVAGFEHVKNNYTYKHRCIELMKNYEPKTK